MASKVALITGASRRIGRAIACTLHDGGYNIVIHCHRSERDAASLITELNAKRTESASLLTGDLMDASRLPVLIDQAVMEWDGLDVLVNNASQFFPTVFGTVTVSHWGALLDTNLKAPYFLAQAAFPYLKARGGCIVNLTDIHAVRGLEDHSVYCISKAGLSGMTRFLAKEFAPHVRVNAVAPGAILWPEVGGEGERQAEILRLTPMGRLGEVQDIAAAVLYLVDQAKYVTGQELVVDGGRCLSS